MIQALGDQFGEAKRSSNLAYQNQTAIGGDPRSMEIHLQRSVRGELKWPVLSLTR